jgi:hypothetical protein
VGFDQDVTGVELGQCSLEVLAQLAAGRFPKKPFKVRCQRSTFAQVWGSAHRWFSHLPEYPASSFSSWDGGK